MLPLSDAQVDNRITAYAVCYLDAAYKSIQAKKYGDTACAKKEYRIMVYLMWAQSMMKRYKAGCITADDACYVMQKADPVCSKCQCGGAPVNPITPVPPCDIHFDRSVVSTVDASQQNDLTGGPYYIVTDNDSWGGTWGSHVGYIVETDGSFTPVADGAIIYDQTSTVFWTSTPTNVPGQYFPVMFWQMAGPTDVIVTSPYPNVNELFDRDVTIEALIGSTWTTIYGPDTEQVFADPQDFTVASAATSVRTTYYIGTCAYPFTSTVQGPFAHDVTFSHDTSHG